MKAEQIKEITEKATEQLVAALQQGHSEALTNFSRLLDGFTATACYVEEHIETRMSIAGDGERRRIFQGCR